jgi:hypothetical protein
MKEKILVIYVGVAGIRSEDIDTFVHRVTDKIIPSTFRGEIITIPVQLPNTVIKCINPEYITDSELIKEHTELMKELQQHLQNQLEQLKQSKNE